MARARRLGHESMSQTLLGDTRWGSVREQSRVGAGDLGDPEVSLREAKGEGSRSYD